MSEQIPAGEVVAAFLEACGIDTAFGVISIHNMPILDAIGRRNRIRFVPARGEAGATNMADAYARVRGGLGVVFTSTGTGSGNSIGAMVEAQTAGTPLLHITGQIERPYLDRNRGYIHEARDQPGYLRAASKGFFRVWSTDTLVGTLREAVRLALTPPMGPVSIEIPIDVQEALMTRPASLEPAPIPVSVPDAALLDALAERLSKAKRPLLWLGGGARHAANEVLALVELGFGVVSSVQGRGIVPEDHPATLGTFNAAPPVEAFYGTCDALLVAGSRLRGNETLKWDLRLPQPLYQIDVDPQAENRGYPGEFFICGDAALALAGLAQRLRGKLTVDPRLRDDLIAAKRAAEASLVAGLGPYKTLVEALHKTKPRDAIWVRDITVSNSTWGNRYMPLHGARDGIHALGGGIGQGLAMSIGAALGVPGRKVVALSGDGGLLVNAGEMATAVQEKVDVTLVVMNDRGYGVIRNIQDKKFGGRHYFSDLHTPEMRRFAETFGWHYVGARSESEIPGAVKAAVERRGPVLLEIDMNAIGPYAVAFAGPPARVKPS